MFASAEHFGVALLICLHKEIYISLLLNLALMTLNPKPYLEGHGDLISSLITPIAHIITPIIPIINPLTKSP